MAAAPLNSLAAQRAALPAELRERRRSEWLRDRRTLVGGAAAGGALAALGAMAVLLGLLLAPSPRFVQPPQLLHPERTGAATPAPSATSPTATPGTSPSGAASAAPGPSTAPTGQPSGTAVPTPTAGTPTGATGTAGPGG